MAHRVRFFRFLIFCPFRHVLAWPESDGLSLILFWLNFPASGLFVFSLSALFLA